MTIPLRSLKTLIVRSNQKGETIAALFLKDELRYPNYPELKEGLIGFDVYYSSHKSPASVIHGVLFHSGEMTLSQEVLGTQLKHGIESFFQVNIPVFERAVMDMMRFIPKDLPLVDYYSGTGSIGLSIGKQTGQKVVCVESNAEAVRFAQQNIRENAVSGETYCSPAELMTQYIVSESALVLDPPRAGLHQNVIDRILEVRPPVIAYLSCNISTQARDVALLSSAYTVQFFSLYNFFPHTPHIEGLCVLIRKEE
jgi:23S rRNA (uracil1939-C5)-methyltransferase